ncbi:MAG: hypothetical protein QM642_00430 [Edaphocola sp.]
MGKSIITLLILIGFSVQNSIGQSLLVTLFPNDCIKCQKIFEGFLHKLDTIPVFYVFPQAFEHDSTEIRYTFSAYKNFNPVYSDKYYNLINCHVSSIALCSPTGEITFKKSINTLEADDMLAIETLLKTNVVTKTSRPLYQYFLNGWLISENFFTSSLSFKRGNDTYQFKLDSVVHKNCILSQIKINPSFYDKTNHSLQDNIVQKDMMKSTLSGKYVYNDAFYFTISTPIIMTPNEEEAKMGLKGVLSKSYTLVKQNLDGEKEYIPIVTINKLDTMGSFSFPATSFVVLNDTTFLFTYYPSNWQKVAENRRYIAIFKLRKNRLFFEKQLLNQYPEIFFSSKIGYSLLPTLRVMDYPFLVPLTGSTISNLSNNTDYDFSPQYNIDYSILNPGLLRKLGDGETFLPVENIYLFNDKISNNIYIISKTEKTYYLNVIDMPSMQLTNSINLNILHLSIHDYPVILYDKDKQVLSIEDSGGVLRGYPMNILENARP